MKRALFLASGLVVLISAAAAAEVAPAVSLAEIFERANRAASRGDHAAAVGDYQSLVEAGVRDADVYFNLATAFAQAGDYPRAILNYERAIVARPGDDRARENLRRAEAALEEQRAEAEGEATIQRSSSIAEAVYGSISEDALAIVVLLANLCFFACLASAWVVRRRSRWLIALMISAATALLLSSFGLAVKAGALRDGPRAIALGERVVLREGPDEKARARGEARGGDRAVVVGNDGDFMKLRVIRGLEGWADASEVGVIDLDEGLH